jgi:hypothetical protein
MKSPDIKLVFASGLLAAVTSVSGCGKPAETIPLPNPIPANAGFPANAENTYHLIPIPCKTSMPWEGVSHGQKSTAESVVVFASVKIPEPKTTPGIGPECWEVIPINSNN